MPSRRSAPAVIGGGLAILSGLILSGSSALAEDDVTYRRAAVADAAAILVLDLPVSEEMTYVEGTASYPDHLLFSLDGGRRFAPMEELRAIDAAGVRPATAADITNLRWHLPAAPGQRIEVSYRAAVR